MHADRTLFCRAVFAAWLVLGALLLAAFGAWDVVTPAGPLAAWMVAMPLACLVVLQPCRACGPVARLAAVRGRIPAPARRLRRTAA